MENYSTRVEKYKEYRSSFLKAGIPSLSTPESAIQGVKLNNTATLPLDSVMNGIEENDEENASFKEFNTKKRFKYIVLLLIAFLLIVGITIFGVVVF